MPIRTYMPQLEVELIKLVGRRNGVSERHAGATRNLRLTPYLGEAGTVQTDKGLSEEGSFSITFADRSDKGLDTVYALIEPMDLIEIRAARVPATGPLPLLMRGFVGTVQRTESMDENGTPRRVVAISGHDAGKLLKMHQIFFEIAALRETGYLSAFRGQARSGMAVNVMGIGAFMETLVKEVVNPRVSKLFAVNSRTVRDFDLKASVSEGSVVPGMLKPDYPSVWALMETLADRPWNELFVEDGETGPVIRFRPVPYKGLDGAFIMPGAADPGSVTLTAEDVVSWDVTRSDKRIANWYWVPPRNFTLETNGLVNQQSVGAKRQLDFDHPNAREDLYGSKKMEASSQLMPDIPKTPSAAPPAERSQLADRYVQWLDTRAEQLKLMNRDNSVFEEGTAKVKGSEALKAGRYLRLERGKVTSEGYITNVGHSFTPLRTWVTTVRLDRCTGFLERSKLAANPYWHEGFGGPYS